MLPQLEQHLFPQGIQTVDQEKSKQAIELDVQH